MNRAGLRRNCSAKGSRELRQRSVSMPRIESPLVVILSFFVAKYTGIPCSAAYYDWGAWMEAYRKVLDEFRPDMAFIQHLESGKAMEWLDPTILRWPGHGVDPNHGMQSIGIEGLREDEYGFFLDEPGRLPDAPSSASGLRGSRGVVHAAGTGRYHRVA